MAAASAASICARVRIGRCDPVAVTTISLLPIAVIATVIIAALIVLLSYWRMVGAL